MARWAAFVAVVFTSVLQVLPQTPLNFEEINHTDCRFRGVFHITLQDKYRLTLLQAHEACRRLGTVLATKEQVEVAHNLGYEKCRYGWVNDGFPVIPRISPLPQCGQNKTGVLIWSQYFDKEFDAYCFRDNDAQKRNACEPLQILTTPFNTETSSSEAVPTTLSSITVVSLETVSQQDSKTMIVLQGAQTLSTVPVELTFSSSIPAADDKENAKKNEPMATWVIYILVMVLMVLVIFVVVLSCYLRKCCCISFAISEQPKEATEAEMMEKLSP
ncbi:lymphatic vessel endothelial hyaluronic acid receptor 1a [Narcine bancroftii]|uniref:lymphatic vessel endothelial hyaluronic acid receptor 1a n=1 Tax=Narcine bancroftii TaxID=1343680 RepID=UPI003831188E